MITKRRGLAVSVAALALSTGLLAPNANASLTFFSPSSASGLNCPVLNLVLGGLTPAKTTTPVRTTTPAKTSTPVMTPAPVRTPAPTTTPAPTATPAPSASPRATSAV